MDVAEFEALEPSIKNVIDQKSLRWIFVEGKGGVGKTTCSSSLAVLLSKVRESVLIMSLSTNPASNLNAAFDQKFSKVPTKVNGFDNLFARVMDPNVDLTEPPEEDFSDRETFMQELFGSHPGAVEVDIYSEVTKLVTSMNYSVVVFDAAPGLTLRLLAFLQALELEYTEAMRSLSSVATRSIPSEATRSIPSESMRSIPSEAVRSIPSNATRSIPMLELLINQEGYLMGSDEYTASEFLNNYRNALGEVLSVCRQVNTQFQDPNQTTFICVCTPDFPSLYETENLVKDLSRCGIDIHNIVVNRLQQQTAAPCALCAARLQEQDKYLQEIADLHKFFHVTKIPLLDKEVRGAAAVCSFSELLVKPYVPSASST